MGGVTLCPRFVYVMMEKTGSSSFREILRNVFGEEVRNDKGLGHCYDNLAARFPDQPVIATVRNPLTWMVSLWLYFKPEGDPFVVLGVRTNFAKYDDFQTWAESNFDFCQKYYDTVIKDPDNTHFVRVEHLAEDAISACSVIKPLTDEEVLNIYNHQRRRVNVARTKPYEDYYTPGLKQKVLDACEDIFARHYPYRDFPEEPIFSKGTQFYTPEKPERETNETTYSG